MGDSKQKMSGYSTDASTSQKVDLKGSLAATPGGKGAKRDATSPPIPPKPIIEKKTREGSSGDSNDTGAGLLADIEEETIEINEPVTDPVSPSHAHVFSKPMHPDDILQIVTELRALMLPEIKHIITENMPDTKSIAYDAVKNATTPLSKTIENLVSDNVELNKKCSELEERVSELESQNAARKAENDDLEQYGRRNILRVSGIPENESEDTDLIVMQVADKLGVSISPYEIDRSHRVGKTVKPHVGQTSTRKSRDIIVKFATYNARNRLFQERKTLRETADEDLKNIFLNEDLTKRRSEILFEARKLRRSGKIKAAYSSDGKITVRDKKDKKHMIHDLDDLVQFGYVKKNTPTDESTSSSAGAGSMD